MFLVQTPVIKSHKCVAVYEFPVGVGEGVDEKMMRKTRVEYRVVEEA